MSRFYRVDSRVWQDPSFRGLSPLAPSGQALWLYLLCANQETPVPGLYITGKASLAEILEWSEADLMAAMDNLASADMAWADWRSKIVWAPGVMAMNRPDNPNMVKAWMRAMLDLPACPMRERILDWARGYLASLGEGFARATRECLDQSANPAMGLKAHDGVARSEHP